MQTTPAVALPVTLIDELDAPATLACLAIPKAKFHFGLRHSRIDAPEAYLPIDLWTVSPQQICN